MDVQTHRPHPFSSLSSSFGRQAGERQLRIGARSTTGPVAGAANYTTGSKPILHVSACPTCVLPGNPGHGRHERIEPSTAAPDAIVMALQRASAPSIARSTMPLGGHQCDGPGHRARDQWHRTNRPPWRAHPRVPARFLSWADGVLGTYRLSSTALLMICGPMLAWSQIP
jgi:hypothetical protein